MLYPNKINKTRTNISHANRGMDLEFLINEANQYYLNNNIAVIYKKPTPVKIKKVNFKNGTPEVKGALTQKSTLDYVGLYKGKYLDFDAKKTLNKTSFPLDNIHEHQINHMRKILNHMGITFLIIEINNKIYYLPGEKLINFIDNEKRKSIPLAFLEANAYIIDYSYNPVLNYLDIINKIYFKEGVL